MPCGSCHTWTEALQKDGSKVEYPKMPLPSEKKWGPEMWTENYRDKTVSRHMSLEQHHVKQHVLRILQSRVILSLRHRADIQMLLNL